MELFVWRIETQFYKTCYLLFRYITRNKYPRSSQVMNQHNDVTDSKLVERK